MSKEIDKKLLEYLDKVDNFFGEDVPSFVKEAMEYSEWELKYEVKVVIGTAIIGVVSILATYLIILNTEGSITSNSNALRAMSIFLTGAIGFLSTMGTFFESFSLYEKYQMFKRSPKLYLLKKVK